MDRRKDIFSFEKNLWGVCLKAGREMRFVFCFVFAYCFIGELWACCPQGSIGNEIINMSYWSKHHVFVTKEHKWISSEGEEMIDSNAVDSGESWNFYNSNLQPIASIAYQDLVSKSTFTTIKFYENEIIPELRKDILSTYEQVAARVASKDLGYINAHDIYLKNPPATYDPTRVYKLNDQYKRIEDYSANLGLEISRGIKENLTLQELKRLSDCGVKEIRKHERIDYMLFDPQTGNDMLLDSFRTHQRDSRNNLDKFMLEKDVSYSQQGCYDANDGKKLLVIREYGSTRWCDLYSYDLPLLIDPNRLEYSRQNIYGFRALKSKDYEKAKSYFAKSLELNPYYWHSNFNMACTLSLQGRPFEEGKIYWLKSLKCG